MATEPGGGILDVGYRVATSLDVPAIVACHTVDRPPGHIGAYLRREYHPPQAFAPRVVYLACLDTTVIGYMAGHLTARHDCDGEVQYLFVTPRYRRRGIATGLLRRLAGWFEVEGARQVCVSLDPNRLDIQAFLSRSRASFHGSWYGWTDISTVSERGTRP